MSVLIEKALIATNSLIDFDKNVISSMKYLSSSWESLGFERLDEVHSFFSYILDYLEFLPIREESLYSEKFLKELRKKEEWFRNNYKEETREIGRKILKKLNEISI
jgi:hypothetical protein